MRILDSIVIGLNKLRCRFGKRRYAAENILLLLPHCLQRHDCKELVKNDIRECKECGRCKMCELKKLVEKTGIPVCVASGGRLAQQRARDPKVQVVLAVACDRELAEGIRAVFPKKVFSVSNTWPNGACHDTDVDVKKVEDLAMQLLGNNSQEQQ